jgi:predicted nucleic acid-binding protein
MFYYLDAAPIIYLVEKEFFDHEITLEIGISLEVIDKATDLRAKYNFKTPDALHLAAAKFSHQRSLP